MAHSNSPGTPADATLNAFVANGDTAPAYWFTDVLWAILVDGQKSGGAMTLVEQWMREGAGPPPHVHACDEWFFVLEGVMEAQVAGETVRAQAGDSIWIPRGTDHSFKVADGDAHALNGYTPAGIEQILMGVGTPAERRELPPTDFPQARPDQLLQFMSNYWSALTPSAWAKTQPIR